MLITLKLLLIIATLVGGAAAVGYFIEKFKKQRASSRTDNQSVPDNKEKALQDMSISKLGQTGPNLDVLRYAEQSTFTLRLSFYSSEKTEIDTLDGEGECIKLEQFWKAWGTIKAKPRFEASVESIIVNGPFVCETKNCEAIMEIEGREQGTKSFRVGGIPLCQDTCRLSLKCYV